MLIVWLMDFAGTLVFCALLAGFDRVRLWWHSNRLNPRFRHSR